MKVTMTTLVTDAQIAQLRRMVAEPNEETYSDETLITYIERYPHMDEQGEEPYTLSSDTPPVQEANDNWIPTYDLHAAAADVWEEKAAAVASKVNFKADGGDYAMSNQYEQYMKMCRQHRSRRMPSSMRMRQFPEEDGTVRQTWIANLAEE